MTRRTRVAEAHVPSEHPATDARWPIVLAIAVRLIAWAVVPASRLASDEDSYFLSATSLLVRGEQDLFWPPITPWLIAGVRWLFHTDAVAIVRLAWVALDVGCVLAVRTLARRVARAALPAAPAAAGALVTWATAGYALYLPAISHAQFATSETPALLQTLLILVLLTTPGAGPGRFAVAGVIAGTLCLTRPSLSPLVVLLPLAVVAPRPSAAGWRRAVLFVLMAGMVVSAAVYRNYRLSGTVTLANNSAYNLYLGNRDLYAEDLNLFDPRATPGQVEFRRQMRTGELAYPTESPAELQRQAMAWIADHPGTFARRMLGRLARVFVPKTDVLELAGGEARAGIFSPLPLALLAVANLQWVVILAGGAAGLLAIRRLSPETGWLLLATVAGALVLCLVAISKPRYSFPFDPLLIIGVAAVSAAPRVMLPALSQGDRRALVAAAAFVAWAWIAWLVFAFTSRAAL